MEASCLICVIRVILNAKPPGYIVTAELPRLWEISHAAKAEVSAQRKCQGRKCVREMPLRPSPSAPGVGELPPLDEKIGSVEEDLKRSPGTSCVAL